MTDQQLPTDEDRRLLRDSVRNLLQKHWPAAAAVKHSDEPDEIRTIARRLAEQGLLALGSDPGEGGLREILILQEELGHAACPVPFLASALLNVLLRSRAKNDVVLSQLLTQVHDGTALAAIGYGTLDGDRTAGSACLENGLVTGSARYLDMAHCATHLVLFCAPSTIAVVDASAQGVDLTPTRAFGAQGLAAVRFNRARALTTIEIGAHELEDLARIQRLALTARAYGAADRAFELATSYARDRKQFGKFIGQFQAVQHKLANNHIALLGLQLALSNAAESYDLGAPEWRTFTAAACAVANGALRQASFETHHAFGAIGYAEEHEAPRHFKRVHQDVLRHGGGRRAREELAAHLLDHANKLPQYDLGAEANAFRNEVRAWLKTHWTPERQQQMLNRPNAHREYDPDFARELGKTGWIGLNWPKKFGGQERSPMEYLAYVEELERHEAPRAGAPIQAVSWMLFGTDEQQKRYLPEILKGEAVYGMWYSEPGSGSDLASMRTRAVRDGDEWVINGEKIWTTSFWGDYMWLAAKTDPDAKPAHAGISMFCFPTGTKGVTIRPVKTMYDGEFINTFLDDVRIPADSLVGEVNGGWEVLTGSLGTERGVVGAVILAKLAHAFDLVCEFIRTCESDGKALRDDPIVRDTIGAFAAQIEIGRQLARHCAVLAGTGETPPDVAAITKVYASELMERFYSAVQEMLGMEAALSAGSEGAILRGRLEQKLRHSLMWVISIGTNEIQRSLIATRGLGLPR